MNSDAKEQLKRVLVAFPGFQQYIDGLPDPAATFAAWVGMLARCDLADVKAVVDEIVSGERDAIGRYQQRDMLAKNIAAEACDRRARRAAQRRQWEKHLSPAATAKNVNQRFVPAMREAYRIGWLRRDGKITEETQSDCMAMIHDWHEHGGPLPAFFGKDLGK